MKVLFLFSTLIFLSFYTSAQSNSINTATVIEKIQLKETQFDFGKIPQGRPVTHVFEITNTSKEPLKLVDVQASCGCTTPEWSRDAIAPGTTATIKVGYNAAAEGSFSKTVNIIYDTNQTKTIVISGTVYKAPATSAPGNASLSLLKQINQ